jgi:hypothetical protein
LQTLWKFAADEQATNCGHDRLPAVAFALRKPNSHPAKAGVSEEPPSDLAVSWPQRTAEPGIEESNQSKKKRFQQPVPA